MCLVKERDEEISFSQGGEMLVHRNVKISVLRNRG